MFVCGFDDGFEDIDFFLQFFVFGGWISLDGMGLYVYL